MILLDHNIPEDQAEQLRRWRVHFRQIGSDVGRPEWDDQQEVLRYLHAAKHATFCTRDLGFFHRRFCHPNYCLVVFDVPVLETASCIRRLLRHPMLKTGARRWGKVLRVSREKIVLWEIGREQMINLGW